MGAVKLEHCCKSNRFVMFVIISLKRLKLKNGGDMELDEFLNNYEEGNLLRRFAFLGVEESFNKKLRYLEKIAEPEIWIFHDRLNNKPMDVLRYYLIHTFDQCFKQKRISIDENHQNAAFNTGLMTASGEEIFTTFAKSTNYEPDNPSTNYWHLNGFYKASERKFLNIDFAAPEMATYFEDYNELYFDPTYEIVVNFDHIYDDNYDRLPSEFQQLPKEIACQAFRGFLDHTKKRIRRNSRIPVPQFYSNRIMFLVPVNVFGEKPIVLALEKKGSQYRANTVLTMNMAYNCARLLTKPESNWLLLK